jgi:hypothetical protein
MAAIDDVTPPAFTPLKGLAVLIAKSVRTRTFDRLSRLHVSGHYRTGTDSRKISKYHTTYDNR